MFKYCISPEKDGNTYGIKNLELCDKCLGAELEKMSGNEIEDLRVRLINNLERVICYTSKIPVAEYDRYVIFFRKAHLIGAENVKLAYCAIKGASDEQIKAVIKIGAAFSIKVLFEIKGEHLDEFGFDRYMSLRSEDTGLIFDPIEFVKLRKSPFFGFLYKSKYKDDIVIVRARDMVFDSLKSVVPEKGNSEIKEIVSCLIARTYNGYFSFKKYSDELKTEDVISAFCNTLCNL